MDLAGLVPKSYPTHGHTSMPNVVQNYAPSKREIALSDPKSEAWKKTYGGSQRLVEALARDGWKSVEGRVLVLFLLFMWPSQLRLNEIPQDQHARVLKSRERGHKPLLKCNTSDWPLTALIAASGPPPPPHLAVQMDPAHSEAEAFPPSLPKDLERALTEVVLSECREMCGTMSLVAYRFYAWTQAFKFGVVVVRPHDDWMQRVRDCFLPNANFIRTLVLDLPRTNDTDRCRLSDQESSLLQKLLSACGRLRHLAVTWNIWAELQHECCALQLQSLYLIWDSASNVDAPSLDALQYPAALKDLTFSAPGELRDPPIRGFANCIFRLQSTASRPVTDRLDSSLHCVNLAYTTYASDRMPCPNIRNVNREHTILLLIGADDEDMWINSDKRRYPNHSTGFLQSWERVLVEWVAKMEGRESLYTALKLVYVIYEGKSVVRALARGPEALERDICTETGKDLKEGRCVDSDRVISR
ncbi:hypothetical protein C8R47DRAFT_1200151 [Mycena vitilis]|nr:hypothetical protein C8R47DRAFT_1200151 [Mycena vitilis]